MESVIRNERIGGARDEYTLVGSETYILIHSITSSMIGKQTTGVAVAGTRIPFRSKLIFFARIIPQRLPPYHRDV